MLSNRLIIRSLLKMEIVSEMFVFLCRPSLWRDAAGCVLVPGSGGSAMPDPRPREGLGAGQGSVCTGRGVQHGAFWLHVRANLLPGVNQHSRIDFS